MRYRTFPGTEITASEVGFGLWTLSTGWWGDRTDDEAVAMLHRVIIDADTGATVRFKMDPDYHRATLGDDFSLTDMTWSPDAAKLDEGIRFPLCRPEALEELFAGLGLKEVEVEPIEIPTPFANFHAYWQPFLGGQGPAPDLRLENSGRICFALRRHGHPET